jgi:transcriptional regulator of acetoin/glycerol metabolism
MSIALRMTTTLAARKRSTGRTCERCVNLTEDDKLRPLDDVLQDVFAYAIQFCEGNKTEAADGLGLSRTTFYRKMGVLRELLSERREAGKILNTQHSDPDSSHG